MSDIPKVSIVMAEYNTKPQYFHECMKSILGQGFADYELIIVDDRGRNDLNELLNAYSDDRIIVLHNAKNLGFAESLNRGLAISRGKYILRMDTDDIMLPNRIEKQVSFMDNHPEYALVGGRALVFDGDKEYGVRGKSGRIKKNDFAFGNNFLHPTLIIRKDALARIGYYPNYQRVEDVAMEMALYVAGYVGYNMPDILIKYREQADSYKKRKFRYRIESFKMRKRYYKLLEFPLYLRIRAFSPLIHGLVPSYLMRVYHEKLLKRSRRH